LKEIIMAQNKKNNGQKFTENLRAREAAHKARKALKRARRAAIKALIQPPA
jgi:hypothetical protein